MSHTPDNPEALTPCQSLQESKVLYGYLKNNAVVHFGKLGWFDCYAVAEDGGVLPKRNKPYSFAEATSLFKRAGWDDAGFYAVARERLAKATKQATDALVRLGAKRHSDVLILKDLSSVTNYITGGGVGGQAYPKNKAYGTGAFEVSSGIPADNWWLVIIHEWAHRFLFAQPKATIEAVKRVYDSLLSEYAPAYNADRSKLAKRETQLLFLRNSTRQAAMLDYGKKATCRVGLALDIHFNPDLFDGKSMGQIVAYDHRLNLQSSVAGLSVSLRKPLDWKDRTLDKGNPVIVALHRVFPTERPQWVFQPFGGVRLPSLDTPFPEQAFYMMFEDDAKIQHTNGKTEKIPHYFTAVADKPTWLFDDLVLGYAESLFHAAEYQDVAKQVDFRLYRRGPLPKRDDDLLAAFKATLLSGTPFASAERYVTEAILDTLDYEQLGEAMQRPLTAAAQSGLSKPEDEEARSWLAQAGAFASSYGAANHDEMWTTTVEYAARSGVRRVPNRLRKMMIDVFSGNTPK